MKSFRHCAGFNLIELIITVAIMTIIAGIAFPIYNGYMDTSRYSEAQNEIAAIKLAQSEYFLEKNTYFGPVTTGGFNAASNGMYTDNPNLKYFQMSVAAGPCGNYAQCYTIVATGINDMAGKNTSFNGP